MKYTLKPFIWRISWRTIWPQWHNLTDNGTSYKLPQWRLAQEFSLQEFQHQNFKFIFFQTIKKCLLWFLSFCLTPSFTFILKMFLCLKVWGSTTVLFHEITNVYSSVPSHDTTSKVTLLPVCFNIATAIECFTFSRLCPSTASNLSPHLSQNKYNQLWHPQQLTASAQNAPPKL